MSRFRTETDVSANGASSDRWSDDRLAKEFSDTEKACLYIFLDKVLQGEKDLRPYEYSSWVERFGSHHDLIELQKRYMNLLSQDEVQRLFREVSKGFVIEVESTLFNDGSSPGYAQDVRKIVDRFGLYEGSFDSLQKIESQTEQDQILSEILSDSQGTFSDTVQGVITAEESQGYSNGVRVETDESTVIDVSPDDVKRFVIRGYDSQAGKRRPREIYLGKQLQVWIPEQGKWADGTISKFIWPDQAEITLDSPIEIKDYFGNLNTLNTRIVSLGPPAIMRQDEEGDSTTLPELGSASIETEPFLYEDINLLPREERKSDPYENVPKEFRPQTLLHFPSRYPNDIQIAEVKHVSAQGVAQVRGLSGVRKSSYEKRNVEWISIPDDQMPTILQRLELSEKYEGDIVRLSAPARYIGNIPAPYVRIKMICVLNREYQVIFESLPVISGGSSINMPPKLFFAMDLNSYTHLLRTGEAKVGNRDTIQQFQQRFPEAYKKLIKYISPDGDCVCTLKLTKEREVVHRFVYFHSLPFGIWLVPEGKREPELVPLEEVISIQVHDPDEPAFF